MNWWIVLIVIWALGCMYMYKNHSDKIDAMKQQDPDGPHLLYDIIGVFILMCWPLMVPKIIKGTVKELKRRRNK